MKSASDASFNVSTRLGHRVPRALVTHSGVPARALLDGAHGPEESGPPPRRAGPRPAVGDLQGQGRRAAGSSACLASRGQARCFPEVAQHTEQLPGLPSPSPQVRLSASPRAARNLLRDSGCSASPGNKQHRLSGHLRLLEGLGNTGLLLSRKNSNMPRTGMGKTKMSEELCPSKQRMPVLPAASWLTLRVRGRRAWSPGSVRRAAVTWLLHTRHLP